MSRTAPRSDIQSVRQTGAGTRVALTGRVASVHEGALLVQDTSGALWVDPAPPDAGTDTDTGALLEPGTWVSLNGTWDGGRVRNAQVTTLTAPTPISLTAVVTGFNGSGVSCNGATNGGIDATIGGGAAPFTFAWSGPNGFSSTTLDLTDLAAGTYTLTATDANGCIATGTWTLTAPQPIVADVTVSDHNGTGISCAGANDGAHDAVEARGRRELTRHLLQGIEAPLHTQLPPVEEGAAQRRADGLGELLDHRHVIDGVGG